MGLDDLTSQAAVGFLTVVADEQHGLTGGYLILNATGRPLEFHCTTPVKPSRAQQILYGPTLEPYLYGEQIGQTLLAKATARPLAICTDHASVLSVRPFVSQPVVLVLTRSQGSTDADRSPSSIHRVDPRHSFGSELTCFELGSNQLAVAADRPEDRRRMAEHLDAAAAFDWLEPFERIREAIAEAHRGSHV